MKRKLQGITIPYIYYDKKENYTYYIYQNQKYTDLNKLFNDFLGSYLTYHYEVKGNLKEVHNLSDILYAVIKNKESFKIPRKYKEEYSPDEYRYIKKLQEKLVKKELKIEYNSPRYTYEPKNIINSKLNRFNLSIYEKYQNQSIPKLVYSEIYSHNYFVVAGHAYESLYHALDEVFPDNLYYEYGGTKRANNRSFSHCHNFDDLIKSIFQNNTKFKIHLHQQELYSTQELIFLNALASKLKKMNFHSVSRSYDPLQSDEYIYLKENNKIFSLLIHNLRYYQEEKKYQREVLKSHKL